MFHKFVSNDNGKDCYRCGMSVDFPWLPYNSDVDYWVDYDQQKQMEDEIHFFLPNCPGPTENHGHHFFALGNTDKDDSDHLIGAIECHYGDAHIGWTTDFAYVPVYCKGDSQ